MTRRRFTFRKSDGAYGEWEVLDRHRVMVPYAWFSRGSAKAEADRLERGDFHDDDERDQIEGRS